MRLAWIVLPLGVWLVLSIILLGMLATSSVALAANFDPGAVKAVTTANSFN